MYPVSDAFREAIVSCDQRAVVRVVVELDGSELGVLPLTGGAVDCDGTRDGALRPCRSPSRRIPTPSIGWRPPAPRSSSPAGILPDGTEELVPLGVFVLDADLEESDDGTISVSAGDRSRRISRARWIDPYVVAAGTPVGEAVADLLRACWPDCPIGSTLAAADKTTGARLAYLGGADSDPWKDARAVAASAGLDLYFDGEGTAQVRDTPDPESDPACWTYFAGEDGVVLRRTRKAILTQQYNGVVVTAEGSGVAVPLRGEAWDDDPNSPTYAYGPDGPRAALLLLAAAHHAGRGRLGRADHAGARQAPDRAGVVSLLPNPAHEAFDVVEFVDADGVSTASCSTSCRCRSTPRARSQPRREKRW